jgi:hypothetical protein
LDLLKFVLEFLVVVEATPSWWFEQGFQLPAVALLTLVTYFAKLLLDVTVTHYIIIGIQRLYWWARRRIRLWLGLATNAPGPLQRLWNRIDGKREALVRWLRRLGHAGLFIAGLTPGLSALGPVLYNLDPKNRPGYRFNNLAFFWLYLGGAVRMLGSVWAIYKLLHGQ